MPTGKRDQPTSPPGPGLSDDRYLAVGGDFQVEADDVDGLVDVEDDDDDATPGFTRVTVSHSRSVSSKRRPVSSKPLMT